MNTPDDTNRQIEAGRIQMGFPETDENELTWSVPEAGSKVKLSKNAAYAAARRGEIPTIRFGKKLRVPKAKFLKMLSADSTGNRCGESQD
jgi:hypothetical protein